MAKPKNLGNCNTPEQFDRCLKKIARKDDDLTRSEGRNHITYEMKGRGKTFFSRSHYNSQYGKGMLSSIRKQLASLGLAVVVMMFVLCNMCLGGSVTRSLRDEVDG